MRNDQVKPFFFGILMTLAVGSMAYWFSGVPTPEVSIREPIPENVARPDETGLETAANPGTLITGKGTVPEMEGRWPQFRGKDRNAIAEDVTIPNSFRESPPPIAWKLDLGEGHAGAAVYDGCVYLVDYDEEEGEDVVRCLSLDKAEEIWRYTYSSKVKRNHGMSRTVPALTDRFLVTLGPKAYVHCFDRLTGEVIWKKDLVRDYGTVVPEWYAGQCPLIEYDRVILAPGGKCLMTAIDLETGETLWETPNPEGWQMTHSSISPVEYDRDLQYVWCCTGGVVGVSADTGELLWHFPDWQIKIAAIPSPLDLGEGRILLTGGYGTGSTLIQISQTESKFSVEEILHLDPKDFGSDQQTPIFVDGVVYAVLPSGKLACLAPDGKRLWINEEFEFGLGPYSLVGGKLLVLDDKGKDSGELCLFEVGPTGASLISRWKVLDGHDAWAPIAIAGSRLILRDAKTMICLDLGSAAAS